MREPFIVHFFVDIPSSDENNSRRILVLDTGLVVEYDSPKNLLDNRESVFGKMALDAGLIASDIPAH